MNVQRWMAVLFLSGFVAAPAVAFEIKPGEWEVETKVTGLPMAMDMPKVKICISPEQAKGGLQNPEIPKDCTMKFHENKKDKISYEMKCKDEGEMKGSVTRISDNEVVTDVTVTTSEGGQKQTVRTVIRQKYIGPTCSSDAINSR